MPLTRRSILLSLLVLPLALAKVQLQLQSQSKGGKHHDDGLIYDGHPQLSSMVGWISIASWLVVSFDQLYLCYAQQTGEGLSLVFLCIWLAGDLTNMLGAIWQGLLPTMIILACYYTICDIILIFQVFYYRRKRALYPDLFVPSSSESDALLSSFSASIELSEPNAKERRKYRDVVEWLGGILGIGLVALVAWRLSRGVPDGRRKEVWDTKAQVVGWISAFLYLGSRLPQIAKNMETKCQGLSLLMFAFSMAGNLTYVASILLTSVDPQHLLINASWLIGSGGTIFLDAIVLGQFYWYASARREAGRIFLSEEGDEVEGDEEA